MKKSILFISLILSVFIAQAQNTWKIKLNKKVLLTTQAEDETKNVKKVKWSEFNKNGKLEILFKPSQPSSDWKNTLIFTGEKRSEIFRKDSITAITSISNTQFKELFAGRKSIKVYSLSVPSDPALAASVRVRWVHVLTLELE